MPFSIKSKQVDLHSFEVTNKVKELLALYEIQGQIKFWLIENKIPLNEVSTLLLNKLVYYAKREINDIRNVNPNLKISAGWYKYGPCFELMRDREMDAGTFAINQTRKHCVEEIAKVCEEEVPLYRTTIKDDIRRKNRFFYNYLKHIYLERNVYKELGKFYPAKHELAHVALQAAYSPTTTSVKDITNAVISFNSEITNRAYANFVGIDEIIAERTFDFTFTLEKALIANKEMNDKGVENERIELAAKNLAHGFDDVPLLIFAYKNYIRTYEDVDRSIEEEKKESFAGEVLQYTHKTYSLTTDAVSILNRNKPLVF